ncbi:SusC/RagA family TonB-linked outer membrane protein [Sphingobacterium sp. HJSM2_6]|uniref:SusC/RagA family TonB-linked outer membrane protein n=1 Tax=Sphingobacterium sp. HJSM2_6 TaxID=3366264 RepID=UPI003BEA40D6
MKKHYALLPMLLGLSVYSFSEVISGKPLSSVERIDFELTQNIIRGKIKNSNGEGVAGASVRNLTSSVISQSNEQGDFEIAASLGNQLRITMVGYTSQDVLVQGNDMVITLVSSNEELDEVVVVGYGRQKKVNLTGAVAQIDSKVLEDRPVANATQALQGAVPNLNINFSNGRPGGEGSVNIRGFASINSANAAPLVLVDGVPGNINNINPRDIESISVLKDASAAAIYGARGAFGVLLVTTKKGKAGKMNIGYSNNFGMADLTVNTDFMTSGYDAAILNDEAFIRATGNKYTGYSDDDYAELLKRKNDPSLPAVVIQNRNGKDQFVYYANTDWWNTFYRDRMNSMEHALTFSGGSEKIDYYISGRLYQKGGLMKVQQDDFNSYNLRSRINGQVTDWLKVSNNSQLNYQNYTYPGWNSSADANNNFISTTVHALPSYVPINPDGTATYRTELNNYNIGDGIMADLLYGKSKGGDKEYEFINLFEAEAKLMPGLVLTGNYTFTYNPLNRFTRRVPAPWSIFPGVVSYLGNDQLVESLALTKKHSLNLFANFNKQLGDHQIGATAGYNQELNVYDNIGGTHTNLLSEDLNDFALGTGQPTLAGGANTWALQGFFGRVNYNYKGRYLLEVNGRYDGTSKFPSNQRYGFFPSFSAGWRIMEEPFLAAGKDIVNEAKIRISYGSLGNAQEAAVYGYVPLLNAGTNNYITNGTKTQFLSSPTPISADLTWERTNTLNYGVDLEFLQNRLTTSFDYFIRETLDMLIPGKTLPSVFGASSPRTNAGDLRNVGWELSLAWRDNMEINEKTFGYNIGIGLSDSKAKITRFDNEKFQLSNYYVGQEVGEIWGYKTAGFFQSNEEAASWTINQDYVDRQRLAAPGDWSKLQAGDLKFVDLSGKDGVPDGKVDNGENTLYNPGDQVIIGNSRARYTFGVNLGANYMGFDVSAFFQGIGRQNWWPGANADKFWGPYSRPYFSFVPKDFEEDVWTPENQDAYFPLLRGYIALNDRGSLNVKSDRYLQDLAYIRLKNLTIGYTVPSAFIQKMKLSRARIFLSGDNIWTATKLRSEYIDPEQASQESNGRAYPYSRTFSFGLDFSF